MGFNGKNLYAKAIVIDKGVYQKWINRDERM